MIGIILTGHGNFASGLTSSLKLIMGDKIDYYEVVDFEGTNTDILEQDIINSIHNLEECDGILICCDLTGGSPFKFAVTSSLTDKNIEVIAGTNLPMLLDLIISRTNETNAYEFAKHALQIGKKMIMMYEVQEIEQPNDDEGI